MTGPILEVRALHYAYGGRSVIQNLSFSLGVGEILALLGPNGSGKSTLLKTIAGILPSFKTDHLGRIFFHGEDVASKPLAWRAARIAYVGADMDAQFPMTAQQAVLLGRSSQTGATLGWMRLSTQQDEQLVQDAMTRCLCWAFRDRDLAKLSGGERQLVSIARALVQGARVLLLDESMSRMDLNHQAQIGKLLSELARQGYSVILVSHDINIASEWAQSALLLKDGERVSCGPIREVLTEGAMRELYPGVDWVIGPSPATGTPKVFFGTKRPPRPLP
ncbi:ABC transporter ATP-binding protein [Bdellovibrionota bacterium FG-1]